METRKKMDQLHLMHIFAWGERVLSRIFGVFFSIFLFALHSSEERVTECIYFSFTEFMHSVGWNDSQNARTLLAFSSEHVHTHSHAFKHGFKKTKREEKRGESWSVVWLHFGCIYRMEAKQWTRYHRVSCPLYLLFVSLYCFNSIHSLRVHCTMCACMQRDHGTSNAFIKLFLLWIIFGLCAGISSQMKLREKLEHVCDRLHPNALQVRNPGVEWHGQAHSAAKHMEADFGHNVKRSTHTAIGIRWKHWKYAAIEFASRRCRGHYVWFA